MKHSSTWFALILIASALFLRAANPASALKPPKPEQNERLTEIQKSEASDNQQTAQAAPSGIHPEPRGLPSDTAAKEEKRRTDHIRPEATIAELVMVGVTTAYVIVAILTLFAIKRQADIAEQIPSIIEAPHISVGMIANIVQSGGVPSGAPSIEYWFKNHGRTQAQITEICTLLEKHAVGTMPEMPEYKTSRIVPFRDLFIVPPSADTAHARCSGNFFFRNEQEFDPVRDSRETCIFYGYVKFRSVFESRPPRIFGFGYYYDPAYNSLNPIGGTAYNYDREDRDRRI